MSLVDSLERFLDDNAGIPGRLDCCACVPGQFRDMEFARGEPGQLVHGARTVHKRGEPGGGPQRQDAASSTR